MVYVTCAVSDEAPRPKQFLAGLMDSRSRSRVWAPAPDFEIEWQVLAIDLASGQLRWTRTAHTGKPAYSVHPSNSYATETPYAGERGVAALFGAAGMIVAYDVAGERLWDKQLGEMPTADGLGTASSLTGVDDQLFIQGFCEKEAWLICLDAASGDEKWRGAGAGGKLVEHAAGLAKPARRRGRRRRPETRHQPPSCFWARALAGQRRRGAQPVVACRR